MPPPAEITGLYRYPIKGLTPEALEQVVLRVGETLPSDRRYAIQNGPSGFDPAPPAWKPKTVFLMLMRNERLAALRSHFADESHVLTIRKGGEVVVRGDLETTEGRGRIEPQFAALLFFAVAAVAVFGQDRPDFRFEEFRLFRRWFSGAGTHNRGSNGNEDWQ